MKPTVGRIVHFYPGKNEKQYNLPNGMGFAPAIITQVCSEERINLTVFIMARPDQGISIPCINAWSITEGSREESEEIYEGAYWTWPPRD